MNNPNKALLLVLCLFSFNNLLAQEQTLSPQKTIITGQVNNLEKYSNKTWIEFLCPDMFNLKVPFEQVEISADGSFRYKLDLVSPALCWGIYYKWIPFVISPGDSLHFTIDANIWGDKTKAHLTNEKYVKITGTVQEDYTRIIKFQEWASKNFYTREENRKNNEAITELSEQDYFNFLQKKEEFVLNSIKMFGEKINAGGLFYKILNDEIYYKTLFHRIRYYTIHPSMNNVNYDNIQIPKHYLNHLSKINQDDKRFHTYNHEDFIKELQKTITLSNVNERETYINSERKKEKATIHDSYYNNQIAHINEATSGLTNDLCLYYFAIRALKSVPSKSHEIYAAVFNHIQDSYIKQGFKRNFFEQLNKNKPQVSALSDSKATVLDSVIQAHPNKVIYVDFWAPWCGPCMKEMHYSKILKQKINNPDYISVYVAVRCSNKSWKSSIANHDMEGINIKLSDSEYSLLQKKYEINGIPHYLLFDKNGKLIHTSAPRPSDENTFDEIMKLF